MLDTQKDNIQKHDRKKVCVMKKKKKSVLAGRKRKTDTFNVGSGGEPS